MSSKITLKDANGYYIISAVDSYSSIEDVKDFLLKPILLAAGFQPESVNQLFSDYEFDSEDDEYYSENEDTKYLTKTWRDELERVINNNNRRSQDIWKLFVYKTE